MPSFKEFFTAQQFITKLGALNFNEGVFGDEHVTRTPHFEMRKALEGYEQRPNINSGINQIATFIVGSKIWIDSDDNATRIFWEKWLEQRKDFHTKLYDFVIALLITGNGYLEKVYTKTNNGSLILTDVFPIADSSRMFKNLSNFKKLKNGNTILDPENAWIYQVPTQAISFQFTDLFGGAQAYRPQWFKVTYTLSDTVIFRHSVYGIPIHKKKIAHMKLGWSRDGIFGRSHLMASVDDIEVMNEIMKNWATVSRHRAMNIKLITLGDETNPANVDDINVLQELFEHRQSHENLIINKPHKISSISSVGEYDIMSEPIDFLRRDIASGLTPTYLTPWMDSVNRSSSAEARIPFELYLQNICERLKDFLNNIIIDEITKIYPNLKKAEFMIDNVELETTQDKINAVNQVFQANAATINELRASAGLESWGENGEKTLSQVQQQPVPMSLSMSPMKQEEPKQQEMFREAIIPRDTKWIANVKKFSGINVNKFEVLKKGVVGGKETRLTKNPQDDSYSIFIGGVQSKTFSFDENKLARDYYDHVLNKLKKQKAIVTEEPSDEEQIIDDAFFELKKEMALSVEKLLNGLSKQKTKKQELSEAVLMKKTALQKIDSYFKGLESKMGKIVKNAIKKVANSIHNNPQVQIQLGDKVEISKEQEQKLKRETDAMLKVLEQNLKMQLTQYKSKKLQDIRRIVSQGIAAGQTTRNIMANVKYLVSKFKTKENPQDWEIKRIIRTEIQGASNLAKLKNWKARGLINYEWVTRNDSRVRPALPTRDSQRRKHPFPDPANHFDRNHKIFKIDDALSGRDIFPGGSLNASIPNVNCRCSPVPYFG